MIEAGQIEETDVTVELTFQTTEQANAFARAWAFKSLMGHTISKNTVKVYNVTDSLKSWIDEYVKNLNS